MKGASNPSVPLNTWATMGPFIPDIPWVFVSGTVTPIVIVPRDCIVTNAEEMELFRIAREGKKSQPRLISVRGMAEGALFPIQHHRRLPKDTSVSNFTGTYVRHFCICTLKRSSFVGEKQQLWKNETTPVYFYSHDFCFFAQLLLA